MTRTETVESVYGTVDVEVTDCDSCGTTIPAEDSNEFRIGNRTGVACDHCVEEGPISFPAKRLRDYYHGFGVDSDGNGIAGYVVLAPIFAPIGMFEVLVSDNEKLRDEVIGFGWACWAVSLWMALAAGLYMVIA